MYYFAAVLYRNNMEIIEGWVPAYKRDNNFNLLRKICKITFEKLWYVSSMSTESTFLYSLQELYTEHTIDCNTYFFQCVLEIPNRNITLNERVAITWNSEMKLNSIGKSVSKYSVLTIVFQNTQDVQKLYFHSKCSYEKNC